VKVSFKKKSNVSGLNKIGFFISWLFLTWSIFAFNDLFWNFDTDWVGYVWFSSGLFILLIQIISVMNKYKRSEDIRNFGLQEYRANPNASIEEISQSTGLSREDRRVKVPFKKKSNVSGLNKIGFFISSLFLTWSIFAFNDLFWNFGSDWVGYIWLSVGFLLLLSQIISVMNKYMRSEDIRNVVLQEYRANPNASIKEVVRNTSLSRNDRRVKVPFKKKSNVSGLNKIGFIISTLFLIWSILAFNELFWNFDTKWVSFIWLSLGLIILLSQIISVMNKYKRSEDIRNVVLQEYRANPNASIEEVSRNIGLSRDSVREILLVLKIKGFLIPPLKMRVTHLNKFLKMMKLFILRKRKFAQIVVQKITEAQQSIANSADLYYNL